MTDRFSVAALAVMLLASACGPGELLGSAVTPSPTETTSPTLTLTSTVTSTSTAAATATAAATQTLSSTAVICPNGTVLRPSLNRCFYASRTPKPKLDACLSYKKASDCISNGCGWNKKTGTCSP